MKKVDRVGEKHITNEGYTIEIVECFSAKNCTIKFEDEITIKNREYVNIVKGKIKNPLHKSVYGVGYFGIVKYSQKRHPKVYQTWTSMLTRCYNLKFQEKHPTYIGCSVVKQWHNFQSFAEWYENNYKEGFDLDKDILLKGNKIYSPETCTFIPHEINGLFTKRNAIRGKYPIGVSVNRNKFIASVCINSKNINIGYFNTVEQAFQAYKTAKESYIKEIADKYKEQITPQTYQALINYQVEIND